MTDEIHLAYDDRYRRRIVFESARGDRVKLDLPKAVRLRDGDGLATENGLYLVVAAPEDLIEVRCRTAQELARMAWHLGNRHLPTEIRDGVIRFRADHVIEAMVRGLGGKTRTVHEPFEPEAGAYDQEADRSGGEHHHDHAHD